MDTKHLRPPQTSSFRRGPGGISGVSGVSGLLLLCLLLVPSATFSYTIYFLDGGEWAVKSPYTVQGDRALVTKLSGEQITIALALIDQQKTARNNVGRLSDVVVIDTTGTRKFTPGSAKNDPPATLRDAIRSGQVRTRDLTSEATNANSGRDEDANISLPLTRGGFPDLDQMLREPLANSELEGKLSSSMRAIGLAKFRLYRGTASSSLMVEITADGRAEVFGQLEALSEAHGLATEQGSYRALEVLMLTKHRTRSGQFVLTQENVPLLANGILTPAEFFVQYVQF